MENSDWAAVVAVTVLVLLICERSIADIKEGLIKVNRWINGTSADKLSNSGTDNRTREQGSEAKLLPRIRSSAVPRRVVVPMTQPVGGNLNFWARLAVSSSPATSLAIEKESENHPVHQCTLLNAYDDACIARNRKNTDARPTDSNNNSTEKQDQVIQTTKEPPKTAIISKLVPGMVNARDISGKQTDCAQCAGQRHEDTLFQWRGTGKEVFLTGSFVNWAELLKMERDRDSGVTFKFWLPLCPGHHEYKFFVDNKWAVDETLPTCENKLHGTNNVLHKEAPE